MFEKSLCKGIWVQLMCEISYFRKYINIIILSVLQSLTLFYSPLGNIIWVLIDFVKWFSGKKQRVEIKYNSCAVEEACAVWQGVRAMDSRVMLKDV